MINITRVYVKDFGGTHRKELRVELGEVNLQFKTLINGDSLDDIGEAFEDMGSLIATDRDGCEPHTTSRHPLWSIQCGCETHLIRSSEADAETEAQWMANNHQRTAHLHQVVSSFTPSGETS